LNSSTYTGLVGHTYAFYSVATDAAGNQETAPLQPQAQTSVNRTNSPPVISITPTVNLSAGQTVSLDVTASDPDGDGLFFSLGPNAPAGVSVNPSTGHLTWPTSIALGGTTNPISIVVTDNGQPSLSATGTVNVILTVVRTAPVLVPIANYSINEAALLLITNTATSSNVPPPQLTFSLGVGAPTNAIINPVTGLFQWRPLANQAPSTNVITVMVIDNGIPNLSASQQFTVVVNAVANELVLSLGSTNLLVGNSSGVPVILSSTLDLTNITVVLTVPTNRLNSLTLLSTSPETLNTVLSPFGTNQYAASLTLNPAASSATTRALAQLGFLAVPQSNSAITYLGLSQLAGTRSDGSSAAKPGTANGRVIIIAKEPALDALPNNSLVVYGQPGTNYLLLFTTSLSQHVNWYPLFIYTQTNTFQTITNIGSADSTIFYRIQKP
jgi:hypothetical protein